MDFTGKRYWLVGASEGLGLALARRLAQAGADVIISARNAEKLGLAASEIPRARAVAMDVGDTASVHQAAQTVGEIDGLVFLAGVYTPTKAQDWNAADVEMMCDVNFTGCARAVGAVLPAMVARGSGHVVITGSLSGFRGLPGAIGYAASKAGTMVLAECLYADLRGTGVKVQLGNPGFIRTRLTDKNNFKMPFLMTPEQAAEEMFTLMRSNKFSRSFPAAFAAFFRLGNFLPDWAYYRLFAPK
jgi:NADP-dependent 3-hydroxy acid dehydrogenase YdfG